VQLPVWLATLKEQMMTDQSETVTLDLPEDLVFKLMLMAHEEDITFNQFVNKILKEELEKDQPFAFLKKHDEK
jgi:hypothetical protein